MQIKGRVPTDKERLKRLEDNLRNIRKDASQFIESFRNYAHEAEAELQKLQDKMEREERERMEKENE